MQQKFHGGPYSRKGWKEEVEGVLEHGIIEPDHYEWAFPVVVAPNLDGSLILCVDYRKTNDMTVRDTYQLPRMDGCNESLGDYTVLYSLDANWGYWKVTLGEGDEDKETFTSHSDTYSLIRIPFGLMNYLYTF